MSEDTCGVADDVWNSVFLGDDFTRLFRIRRTACFDSVYVSVFGSCLEDFLTFTT